MARIGANSWLPDPVGRWRVVRLPAGGFPSPERNTGGLAYWAVTDGPLPKKIIPPYRRFRVHRDAVRFAARMELRAP